MTSPRHAERGQALAEFCVISGALVSLLLGIWYIGKYHDIQAAAIQSARYAAWERTAHPTSFADSQIQNQARARVFQWDGKPLAATDGIAGNGWSTQTAMWRAHDDSKSLVDKPGDVTVTTQSGALPGSAANAMSVAIASITKLLGAVSGGEALNQGGYYTSHVSVQIANIASLPDPLNNLGLILHESSSLATDSWDASGPKQAALRTRDFTLTSVFDRVTPLLLPLKLVVSPIEPAFAKFDPGQICPDIVPADRLDPGVSKLPVYQGGGSCY
jgi:hypothetical protein